MLRPLHLLILNSARKWIGEAAHTLALAEGLTRRGHRVLLGLRRGYELEGRARESGLPVLPLALSSRFNIFSDASDWRAIRRAIREESIDLVHCHRGKDHWLAALALAAGGMPPVPLVRTRHVVTPAHRHAFNRWLYSHATRGVVAVSDAAMRSLGTLVDPIAPECRRIVYSAVDTSRFAPPCRSDAVRRELGADPDDILIGLIGRIQRVKGQRDFIRAAARVVDRVPRAKFLVAGRGTTGHVERLRRFAQDRGLGPDRFAFRGWIPDLPPVIASLDVGVIASVGSEGSSRVALEYLASGVAVVATRVGGIPELLNDGTDAILVPPRDPEALGEGILRLADDESLRRTLAQEGRNRTLDRFGIERWIDEVSALYRSVL
ncbi:glycosyltransferase family 4 protein [Candidatus Sumerlaeota bacterium]|nr:glycosyltransferase family 4 protein [Candidatus Sumerlaeota bacterium]